MKNPSQGTRRRARIAAAALTVAVLGVTTACSGGSSGGSASSDGKLVWSIPSEVTQLDPLTSSAADWTIFANVYDTLVTLDDNLKPQPSLAKSWDQPTDKQVVLTIRDDAKFSNGRTVTNEDVAGTLNRLIDPKNGAYYAGKLGDIASIKAVGADKVEVNFNTPNSYFIPALSNPSVSILPMKELKAKTFNPSKQLLGSGPFKVEDHVQNQSWTMVPNPGYWGPKPTEKNLKIQIQGTAAAIASLRDGSVDVATFGDASPLKQLKGQANVKTKVVPSTNWEGMYVNAKTGVFADKTVRQALAIAIDRKEIADVAMGGTSEPQATPTATGLNGSCSQDNVPLAESDSARAKQMVTDAGAEGKKVAILAGSEYPVDVSIAQVLQAQLKKVGLDAKIEQVTSAEFTARAFNDGAHDFNIGMGGFAGWSDAAMVLPLWDPKGAAFSTGWFIPNKELNADIVQTQAKPVGERDSSIQAACDLIAKDANIIPLTSAPLAVAYRQDAVSVRVPAKEANFTQLRYVNTFKLK